MWSTLARYDTNSDINTSLISYHTIWAWHYQVKIDITKRVIPFKTCKLPYHMIYNIFKIQGQALKCVFLWISVLKGYEQITLHETYPFAMQFN